MWTVSISSLLCYLIKEAACVVDPVELDFRMLSKETEGGKQLTPDNAEHLMALFGTFPPGVHSEP